MALEQVKGLQPDSSGEALSCLDALQKQTAEIITDVQALSHELHPPRLLHLGVVAAMRGFCGELSGQKNVEIDFRSRERSWECTARRVALSLPGPPGSPAQRGATQPGPSISMCIFAEPGTPSISPFVMKALASTSMRRVEAWDSA